MATSIPMSFTRVDVFAGALVALCSLCPSALRAQGSLGGIAARQMTVERQKLPAAVNAAIVKGDVIAVTPAGDTTRVDSAKKMVTLQANQILVGRHEVSNEITDARLLNRLKDLAAVAGAADVQAKDLPVFTVERAADGTTLRTIQPYILGSRLRYDQANGHFAGSAHIGIRIVDTNAGGKARLNDSISFSLTSDDADITPARLSFGEANGAPAIVSVTTKTPVDSVRLRLTRHDLAGADMDTYLQLQPVLQVVGIPVRMQGYGLERRAFSVGLRGAALRGPAQVQLGISAGGEVEPSVVTLASGEAATVAVTVDVVGPVKLTASAQNVASTELPIEATPPWRYLIATLLGGLLGAAWASASFRGQGRKRSRVRLFITAVLGAIIGAVAAIGLGLNLSWMQVGAVKTTVAVFAFSALLAAGGLKVVPWQQAKPE